MGEKLSVLLLALWEWLSSSYWIFFVFFRVPFLGMVRYNILPSWFVPLARRHGGNTRRISRDCHMARREMWI